MSKLFVARILFPVRTLGPGDRLAVWLYGCDRKCAGCANPELWDCDVTAPVEVSFLFNAIRRMGGIIDGVTVTGGEPLLQCEAVNEFLDGVLTITEDILLYTGYRLEELDEEQRVVCRKAAVVVDGAYIQEENRGHPLKGSANQNIYYRNVTYKSAYEEYMETLWGRRAAQTFRVSGGVVVPGIHEVDFMREYRKRIKK